MSRVPGVADGPARRTDGLYQHLGPRPRAAEAADVWTPAVIGYEPPRVVAWTVHLQRQDLPVREAMTDDDVGAGEHLHDLVDAGAVVGRVDVEAVEARVVGAALDEPQLRVRIPVRV